MKSFIMTGMLAILAIAGTTLLPGALVHGAAYNPCDIDASSSLCSDQNTKGGYKAVVKNITDIILFAVGAAAVIVIIISAIRYVVSTGDPGRIASAKKTLIGAIAGLLVAIFAYAIVSWVFSTTTTPASPPGGTTQTPPTP